MTPLTYWFIVLCILVIIAGLRWLRQQSQRKPDSGPFRAPYDVCADSFGYAEVRDADGRLVDLVPGIDHETSWQRALELADRLNSRGP